MGNTGNAGAGLLCHLGYMDIVLGRPGIGNNHNQIFLAAEGGRHGLHMGIRNAAYLVGNAEEFIPGFLARQKAVADPEKRTRSAFSNISSVFSKLSLSRSM